MNKHIFTLIIAASLFSCNSSNNQSETSVESSSVSAFFQMADKLTAGTEPSESEWNALFETQGYKKCIAETFDERGIVTQEAMRLAFNPEKAAEKDSILKIPVEEIISDGEKLFLRVTLDNFLDTKKNRAAIEKEIRAINGKQVMADASKRLKNFLINPVDSLITTIPVSLLCMEPDALSLSGRIVWDSNLFYKGSYQERIDLLAHEMFHAYRRHFVDYSKRTGLIGIIDGWLNEGIADLIDKKSISELSSDFLRFGFPHSYVDEYNNIYELTPATLKELEKITLDFINNEISKEEFESELSYLEQFGGHPNAYYMTTLITKAGFGKELISNFDSPVEFMKLYNKSIPAEYKLGNEFMEYIETL